MIVYLSGLKSDYFDFVSQFKNFGVLASFAKPDLYFEYKDYGFEHILLDSGAYSVSTGKAKIDIDKYIEFLTSFDIKDGVNLDVISNGQKSFENWQYIQSKVNVMPVYHFNTDMSFLHKYCEKTKRVGLSARVKGAQKTIKNYLDRIFPLYPDYEFHLFGCTSIPVLTQYPIYSCDSTSWMNGTRMGWVITPYGNFFLNKNRDIPNDIELFLREKYNLLTKEEYATEYDFGVAINKVNIYELNYLLCNRYVINNNSRVIELF